jgi:branched-subunit amino acid aminotransferase/4-amino-4-deoxychorismate lyase
MPMKPLVEINGHAADTASLAAALQNYGHFSSMQLREGRIAGLSLHLQRLAGSTRLLFGCDLDTGALRGWLRQAVQRAGEGAIAASSLRVQVYSAQFARERPGEVAGVDVLISVGPPGIVVPARPIRVQTQRYQRDLPQVKHIGTFGLLWQRRLAQQSGYDDALFVDAQGRIIEGSVWNIGFWDGHSVIWPQAPMLDGVAQQLLKGALAVPQQARELRLGDLAGMRAAFTCNSTGSSAIVAIDRGELEQDAELTSILSQAQAAIAGESLFPGLIAK